MLQDSTLEDLKLEFETLETDESNTGILPAPFVEVVTLDLIRVHINTRYSSEYINLIVNILQANHETGPLRIKENMARSCNLLYSIDITSF